MTTFDAKKLALRGSIVAIALLGLPACKSKSANASPAPPAVTIPIAQPPATPVATQEPLPIVAIPAIEAKLPIEKLDIDALYTAVKADKSKLVGKKVRVRGNVNSISYNQMVFDAEQHGLHGPESRKSPGGVYGVEVWGKQRETSVSCFVDEATQKELLALFTAHYDQNLEVEVEGIIEPTFGDLAPCRVRSKKQAARKR